MIIQNNVIKFKNIDEFQKFKESKKLITKLGTGSEGDCFLSQKDNFVYKILNNYYEELIGTIYYIDKIITTKDIDLKNFFLPEELYAIRNKLIAYKIKYVTPNLFDYNNCVKDFKQIYNIDFEKLLRSYYSILKDIEKLSDDKIKVYDLSWNLMFTGEQLIGIDTCGYSRVTEPIFDYNKFCLDEAIKDVFFDWIDLSGRFSDDTIDEINTEDNMETYVKKLSKLVKKERCKDNC